MLNGMVVTQASTTEVNISAGTYTIEDPTDLSDPTSEILQFPGATNLTITGLGAEGYTILKIDRTGTVTQHVNGVISDEDWRLNPFFGYIAHVTGAGVITDVVDIHTPAQNPGSRLSSMFNGLGRFKTGLGITPDGANLQINALSGSIYGPGINPAGDHNMSPDRALVSALTPVSTILYFSREGLTGSGSILDIVNYNPTGDTISPIGGGTNDCAIQRVYRAPNGAVGMQYGQNIYTSPAAAISALFNGADTFVVNPVLASTSICVGYVIAQRAETDLNNADFFETDRFGDVAGAPASSGGLTSNTFAIVENQTELDTAITEGKTTIFVSQPITISATSSPAAPDADLITVFGHKVTIALAATWSPSVATFEWYDGGLFVEGTAS
jgi:hypothetical protein